MIEWATESPWWAFFFLVVTLTTIENMYKYTIEKFAEGKRVKQKSDDSFIDDYMELSIKYQKLANEYKVMKAEAKKYEEMYTTLINTYGHPHKAEDWSANRANQERRAREAMDRQQKADYAKKPTHEETWQMIKSEYRKHMKANHPDKVRARGGSEADIAKATKYAQKLNADYELAKKRFGK